MPWGLRSAFHRACHQAADEVAAAEHVDHQRRECRNHGGGHVDVVLALAGGGHDHVVEATVMGALVPVENDAPKRKSFQMLVNCQMTATMMIGPELGSSTRLKIEKKRAPSIMAAFTSSSGKAM